MLIRSPHYYSASNTAAFGSSYFDAVGSLDFQTSFTFEAETLCFFVAVPGMLHSSIPVRK
jgi:hypothetical protein